MSKSLEITAVAPYGLDFAAFLVFLTLFAGYGLLASTQRLSSRSIVGAMQRQRMQWMRNMAVRDNRVVDTILLGGLGQGNAFFASTSAIAIGGLAAILGSGERAQRILETLPMVAHSEPFLFEIKVVLMIIVFIYAFFKFAWAFRLSHYAAILIGATPIIGSAPAEVIERHARATARLVGLAAEHANAGLRSFYAAMAVLAWFFHPLLFMLASAWVLAILVRRDFFSRSRILVAGLNEPADGMGRG